MSAPLPSDSLLQKVLLVGELINIFVFLIADVDIVSVSICLPPLFWLPVLPALGVW